MLGVGEVVSGLSSMANLVSYEACAGGILRPCFAPAHP